MPASEWLAPVGQADDLCRLAGPLAAHDPHLLKILRSRFLEPPSVLPYNFSTRPQDTIGGNDFTWPWIHEHLRELFQDQEGGFFVEAGALDGVYLSNTLWLERNLGWTGLFIEPDEESFKALRFRHRRAWISNTCLSSTLYPRKTVMVSRRVIPKTLEDFSFW